MYAQIYARPPAASARRAGIAGGGRLGARHRAGEARPAAVRARIKVIPVTAAPAGWCDAMARMWPVDAVIAENGGLSFVRDGLGVRRRYFQGEAERRAGQFRLLALGERIAASVPGAALAPDQPYRETTLAISFADEGQRRDGVARALAMMKAAGARATVNSLWVLGWFGAFDKLEMTRLWPPEEFGIALEAAREQVFDVGDFINDEPMFGFFSARGRRRHHQRLCRDGIAAALDRRGRWRRRLRRGRGRAPRRALRRARGRVAPPHRKAYLKGGKTARQLSSSEATMSPHRNAADIRAGLNHPIIDADGHWVEYVPVFAERMRKAAGEQGGRRLHTPALKRRIPDVAQASPSPSARGARRRHGRLFGRASPPTRATAPRR